MLVICINIIDTANRSVIVVFKVGTSPINNQVNKPKVSVPIPNPASLIFQNAPKCSKDHLVEYQYKGAITKLVAYTNHIDLKKGLSQT